MVSNFSGLVQRVIMMPALFFQLYALSHQFQYLIDREWFIENKVHFFCCNSLLETY